MWQRISASRYIHLQYVELREPDRNSLMEAEFSTIEMILMNGCGQDG